MVSRLSRYIGVLVVLLSLVMPALTVVDVAAQAGFPLTANTAFCEPGYSGPFVGCTPWERVTVSFTAVDQRFAQTCVTAPGERTAGCTVEVPFGATIIASIDPAIVPAGYVLEGPAALEVLIPDGPPEGQFGGPAFVLLPVSREPVPEQLPVVEQPPAEEPPAEEPSSSTEQPPIDQPIEDESERPPAPAETTETPADAGRPTDEGGLPAGLYAGTCSDPRPGASVARLTRPRVPAGERIGAEDATSVATSFTKIPVPFDQVVNGTYVIAVLDPDYPDTMVACGSVGGTPDDNGALSVGLQPRSGNGTAGVAYISADDSGGTVISLFVSDLMAAGAPGAVASSGAYPAAWSTSPAQIKVAYRGCPVGTDMAASADALMSACNAIVGGSSFVLIRASTGGGTDTKISSDSPGFFWMTQIQPDEYILQMRPVPPGSAAFCEGNTGWGATFPYSKMQIQPYSEPIFNVQYEGIELVLTSGESVECDWFVLAKDVGAIFAMARFCPAGWNPTNKPFEKMKSECGDPMPGVATSYALTSGGSGSTVWHKSTVATWFHDVTPGPVSITENVPGGYAVVAVACQNSLWGLENGWNVDPSYQATVSQGTSVIGTVTAGDMLACYFFHVPASSTSPGNAMTAILTQVTGKRLR